MDNLVKNIKDLLKVYKISVTLKTRPRGENIINKISAFKFFRIEIFNKISGRIDP